MLATFFARLTVYIIGKIGGYHIINNQIRFVKLDDLSHNFYLYVLSFLEIFQSNFFGRAVLSRTTLFDVFHALFIGAFIFLIVIYLKNRNDLKEGRSLIDLCTISIVLSSLAFIFSTEPVDVETARYLLDIPALTSILFGVLIARQRARYLLNLSAFAALIFSMNFIEITINGKPASSENRYAVVKYLKAKNLDYGFAGYWNAAPFTLLSNNVIKVRQVRINKNGIMVPFFWLSDSDWYKQIKHPQFAIIGKSGNFGLTDSVLIKNFGYPESIKNIGEYKVYVWK